MSNELKPRTLTSLLAEHSHITLCPISDDETKESNINFGIECDRLLEGDADVICWYGDRKSQAKVGELFAIVRRYSKAIEQYGEGNVVYMRVVAVLDGIYTPSDWVNPKHDRKIYVLSNAVHFASSWCDLNEALGHARTQVKHGVEYTPFLAGMSRRKLK